MASANIKIKVDISPSVEEIKVERVNDAIIISGKTFSYEQIGDVCAFSFLGNIKGRRVIRENIKAIREFVLNG